MAMSRSFGRPLVDARAADADLAFGDVLQPGDHAQQRALAAARRPDQHDELAILDRQVDAVQHRHDAEILAHIADVDRRHGT